MGIPASHVREVFLSAVTTRAPEFTPATAAAPARVPAIWRWALLAVAIAVLFFVYWRQSLAVASNSDSAATALQAWDILHGNLLLHGWWMSDVSFYTTEIPQYVLLEIITGLTPMVVHLAAAMTYTLIVVLVALVAKGSGRESSARGGLTRALLAGAIAMSPQVSGALILLLGPDHTGTVVPVLATWLLIDRARQRWYVPVLVCVMLTWIMVADSVVLFTGIGPLVIAAVLRSVPRRRWYELSLAGAAVVAAGLGTVIPRVMAELGGYQVWHFQTHMMPLSQLPRDAWHTVEAVLELFGANVFGASPAQESMLESVLVAVHFAGVLLAVAALGFALGRFFREDGILVPGLAVAILIELGAFLISIHSRNLDSIRELVAVMPFGAVLAGRLLAAPLTRLWARLWRWKQGEGQGAATRGALALRGVCVAVLAVVAGGYLGSMAYGAARPTVPSSNQALATWLTEHHLTYGLASYWEAGSVTLDTHGQVQVSGVLVGRHGKLGAYYWEVKTTAYDWRLHDATFVVAAGPASVDPVRGLGAAARRTFGPPDHVYHTHGYTILVWNRNLLRHLP
jgi:hypothetical protein